MRAAFVVMSILGCDDSGLHCRPVATVARQWPTVAACDAASDKMLAKYQDVDFPMVVAVCQTAGTSALADSEDNAVENDMHMASRSVAPPQALPTEDRPGFAARAMALLRNAIPSRKGIKSTLVIPVHFVTDTYSWVARKVTD